MRVEIVKWPELQHYKGRDPLWIKLYRNLRHKREWRQLPPAEAKFLIDLWMFSSEQPTAGVIDLPLEDVAWEFREDAAVVERWLYVLAGSGFIVMLSDCEQAASPHALAREETETETETETTAPAEPTRSVENSAETIADRPTYTLAVLAETARTKLGLGRLNRADEGANKRILNDWLYAGSGKRKPEDIMLAIEGAADMRDRDLVGWESAKPGTPMTLKALQKAFTLDHTGDGAPRYLYDVAIEHQRRLEEAGTARAPTPTARTYGNPMARLKADPNQMSA